MAAGILLALGTTKPTFATQRGAFQPVELGWNRAMTRAVVSLAGGASSGAPAARVDWDITSLLERTCQLDRLYETPGYRVGMASGYDRTLGNSGASGCIRAENGRYLMADLQGPGAVVRLWSANPTGKIGFISTTPANR